MSNPVTCDVELLRHSLGDCLSEQQEESLALHLASCVACQHELERLAGQRSDWEQVSQALRIEAQSSAGDRQGLRPSETSHIDQVHLSDDSPVDFVVDFLEPSSSPEAIGRIGEIEVLEVIGRGGMGIVLKGYQPELKRLVAVKVLAPQLAISGSARQRFAREAQATAAIMHPNVVPILMVQSTGKLPFLVMPFLACESLHERIARQGPLELVDLLRISVQTAEGLAAAHAQGIVHRDVKPANILLERGVDRVMLTDFGLARAIDDATITRTGIIAGTPQYMSPEQARGDAVDARSDLFSLGSVIYTMATGRPPFRAESTYGILRRITDSAARPVREINSALPAWLAAIIEKLHAKQPSLRFDSAADVARLFEQCLAHVQQPTLFPLPESCRPPRGWKVLATWRARTALLAIGLALSCLAWWTQPPAHPLAGPRNPDLPAHSADRVPSSSQGTAIRWDAAADELDQLDRDSRPFESRVRSLWDPVAPPAADAPLQKQELPATEITP